MYQYLATSKPFIASIFIGITITLLFSCEIPSFERPTLNEEENASLPSPR